MLLLGVEYKYNPIHDKNPAGPSVKGGGVTYTLRVPCYNQSGDVFFVLIDDANSAVKKIRMPLHSCDAEYFTYKVTISFKTAGLYWYHFIVGSTYLCKNQIFDVEPKSKVDGSFAQVVIEKPVLVDENYNGGVIYHIFVDRFKKTDTVKAKNDMILRKDWGGEITKNTRDFLVINKECFGGNLHGIIEKLPYIKSLGVKTIYLSPIFESNSYHKYDTADFMKVDDMLGGNKAFDELLAACRREGIGVLLDGVFNHVGSDSIYFNKDGRYTTLGAYQSKESEYYDWFSFEKFPNKYSSWWGIDTLPQLNEKNKELQQFIAGPKGVIATQMKPGVLGFRLDVVDEITDDYLNKICARIKSIKPDALILGEVWEDAATKIAYDKRRFYFSGNQLNGVMNYPLKNAIIDFVVKGNAEELAGVFYMLKDHYPKSVQNNVMNFLGTHDTKRILTVLGEARKKPEQVIQSLKMASAIQYCAPGVPTVFYGDEAGVTGGDAPFCRVCFPCGKENKNILAWYRKLGELRANEVFYNGDCNILFAHNGVFIFERVATKTRVVVAANCSTEDFKLNLKNPMKDFESNKTVKDNKLLAPYDFVILTEEVVKSDKGRPAKGFNKPTGVSGTPAKTGRNTQKNP